MFRTPGSRAILRTRLTVKITVFTANSTYIPALGLDYCQIECWGGGGGGGGTAISGASVTSVGAAGGAGSYSRKIATAFQIGPSQTVTIGIAGTGGAAGNNNGNPGGDTSVGTLCIAKGGSGGTGSSGAVGTSAGGLGGVAGTGDVTSTGQPGAGGAGILNTSGFSIGPGGSTLVGGGAVNRSALGTGNAGTGHGSGGGGGLDSGAASARAGGDGTSGYVIITEFIIS